MTTPSSSSALLLIDIQQGLDNPKYGERNIPDAERRIAALLTAWRRDKRPVIHVQHMSQEPDSPLRAGCERPGRMESWSTPVLHPSADQPEVVMVFGSLFADAYDLTIGEPRWELPGLGLPPVG